MKLRGNTSSLEETVSHDALPLLAKGLTFKPRFWKKDSKTKNNWSVFFTWPVLEECAYKPPLTWLSRAAMDLGLSYAWSFTFSWILWPAKHPFDKLPNSFSLSCPSQFLFLPPNPPCSNLPLYSVFKPTFHVAFRIISIPHSRFLPANILSISNPSLVYIWIP